MWQSNDKHFHFLDLPVELRSQIYEYAFGSEIDPLSTVSYQQLVNSSGDHNARLTFDMGYNKDMIGSGYISSPVSHLFSGQRTLEVRPPVDKPDLALLRVCQATHEEMLHVGWAVMRKRLFDPRAFVTATEAHLGPAMRFSCLKTIELCMTKKDLFDFFGVEMDPQFKVDESLCCGRYLQGLTGVTDLQLRFRYLNEGYSNTPWGEVPHKIGLRRYNDHRYVCCQRTLIDWIYTLAYPFVHGIETVTITGKVKTDSKQKWNANFKGTRAHDQAAEMAAIFATPDSQL
jgi:hypothetical protein